MVTVNINKESHKIAKELISGKTGLTSVKSVVEWAIEHAWEHFNPPPSFKVN